MRNRALGVTLILTLVWYSATGTGYQSVAGRRLTPVDEAAKDPSFAAFRRQLLKAARAGDVRRVLSMATADVRFNEDLESTIGGFREAWEIDSRPRRFLDSLIDVLQHGGRFDSDGRFVAPWTYTEFPGSELEMKTCVVVVRASAPVFAAPRESSPVLQRISYRVFEFGGGPPGWYSVRLKGGREGYMRDADIRQPSDARAYFQKIKGVWKLVIFAKGMD